MTRASAKIIALNVVQTWYNRRQPDATTGGWGGYAIHGTETGRVMFRAAAGLVNANQRIYAMPPPREVRADLREVEIRFIPQALKILRKSGSIRRLLQTLQ